MEQINNLVSINAAWVNNKRLMDVRIQSIAYTLSKYKLRHLNIHTIQNKY
jgi:hypothetical protein